MICKKPYIAPGLKAFPCGSCLACRINRRRVWTHRLILEGMEHDQKSFITLTYDDKHLPKDGSLVPGDLRNFIKKLRRAHEPERIRFFACGEYGDQTQRPHYHVIAFGSPPCSVLGNCPRRDNNKCCSVGQRLRSIWQKGLVHVGEVSEDTAAYVAGYCIKKLGDCDADDNILQGRHPEFVRMSNRPGIGFSAVEKIAQTIEKYGDNYQALDVPVSLGHARNKKWPLGKYIRRKLRARLGRPENAPQEIQEAIQVEMQELREKASGAPKGFRTFAFQQALVDQAQGKLASLEWWQKNKGKRKAI